MTKSALLIAIAAMAIFTVPATAQEEKPKSPVKSVKIAETSAPVAIEKNVNFEAIVKEAAAAPVQRNPGEMMLTDIEGRQLNVELLAANGDMLRIKRVDDAKEFEIQMAQLDEISHDRVKNWIERNPEMTNFSIAFEVGKRLAEADEFESAGRSLKTSQWVYDITMTNQTRNLLSGAEVEYRIIYDDEVAFSRTSAMPGKGGKQQDGENVELPDMSFNERAEFTTPRVELHTYNYAPTRGQREFEKDKLIGIWIRVTKRGQILDEYQSNVAVMRDLSWDGEEETGIVIRDSFKEEFE